MKNTLKNTIAGAALGLLVAQGALADGVPAEPVGVPSDLLAEQFTQLPLDHIEVLDGAQMQETRGELWPLIGAVVTVDLALATFFWGTYVPSVTGTAPMGGLLTPNPY